MHSEKHADAQSISSQTSTSLRKEHKKRNRNNLKVKVLDVEQDRGQAAVRLLLNHTCDAY